MKYSLFVDQVSIDVYGSVLCGGSIIAENYVLTAAHCAYDKQGQRISNDKCEIVAGRIDRSNDTNAVKRTVKNIHIPGTFNLTPLLDDIAIIEVSKIT